MPSILILPVPATSPVNSVVKVLAVCHLSAEVETPLHLEAVSVLAPVKVICLSTGIVKSSAKSVLPVTIKSSLIVRLLKVVLPVISAVPPIVTLSERLNSVALIFTSSVIPA